MEFGFSEEQLELRGTIRSFARDELNKDLVEREQKSIFPRENWQKCADLGIQGLPFPVELGGGGADIVTTTLAMEALGYGCKDGGLLFGIAAQLWSVQMPIWEFGSEAQQTRYLPRLCSGELIGAHAMTEPDSGSDAFSLRTTAEKKADRYVLNGVKTFVTNGSAADVFLAFASIDRSKKFMGLSAFLVERGTPGFRVEGEIGKMGLQTCPMVELVFEDCEVPAENRLGVDGRGAAIFQSSMEWERSFILAACVGAMERQLNGCVEYAKQRRQYGKPIIKFQSVANKIVDMKVRMEAARLLLYKTAWLKSNDEPATAESAIAKLYLSESWVQSCLDAVQLYGGYGYTTEFEIERDLRDSIATRLYSGTSEIQRNIIARCLEG